MSSFRSLTVKGHRGSVRVGALKVADLGRYAMDPIEGKQFEWRVRAAIVSRDAFWLSQHTRPRDLVLDVGTQGSWTWRGVTLEIDGDEVRGTLSGRPEIR